MNTQIYCQEEVSGLSRQGIQTEVSDLNSKIGLSPKSREAQVDRLCRVQHQSEGVAYRELHVSAYGHLWDYY